MPRKAVSRQADIKLKQFHVFYDAAAEKSYLDELGKKGLLLNGTTSLYYFFEKTGSVWHYTLEWLDSSPYNDKNKEHIQAKCRDEKLIFCGKRSCFAIYASQGEPEADIKAESAKAKHYSAVAAFWSVIGAYLAGLCAYYAYWTAKFGRLGYTDDSLIIKNPAVITLAVSGLLLLGVAALAVYLWRVYGKHRKTLKALKAPEKESLSNEES